MLTQNTKVTINKIKYIISWRQQMNQTDSTHIRLRRSNVKRLRGIGTRDDTDDDVVGMLLDIWDKQEVGTNLVP